MKRFLMQIFAIVTLTLLTQVGGIAWIVARLARHRFLTFFLVYAGLSIASLWVAPVFGRMPLPCQGSEPIQMKSWVYCALNRQYVSPKMHQVIYDLALTMDEQYPGTVTLALDANFPFFNGFPLLPHLSHNDGKKLDLAFYYRDATRYMPAKTRSLIGYFAFENGPTSCPPNWISLRWDMPWLQAYWQKLTPDKQRMRTALQLLTEDPNVSKIFIEPHLQNRFDLRHPKLRFQGCNSARHDDHFHIEL